MLWDVFCRVVDNFGDVGVCWRLARGLAARGAEVRLWLDDASALSWMAPEGAPGVQVLAWPADHGNDLAPGDVVIEAFGCDPPPAFVARMAARRAAPVWINLEYLSAETYVERSHGLRSPQLNGPGAGLDKWFFYPGFTPRTGGLLRSLPAPDHEAWLADCGWAPRPHERLVLLFCYDNPALPRLLQDLASAPTLLLLAPGPAQRAVAEHSLPPDLRTIALPWLPQQRFDDLLHCTDLNIVRGEDSFTQANFSSRPCLWQLYPQVDEAHGPKLEAFIDRFLAVTGFADGDALRALWRGWNGLAAWPARWPDAQAWSDACVAWRNSLAAQDDLLTQLARFVNAKR